MHNPFQVRPITLFLSLHQLKFLQQILKSSIPDKDGEPLIIMITEDIQKEIDKLENE